MEDLGWVGRPWIGKLTEELGKMQGIKDLRKTQSDSQWKTLGGKTYGRLRVEEFWKTQDGRITEDLRLKGL